MIFVLFESTGIQIEEITLPQSSLGRAFVDEFDLVSVRITLLQNHENIEIRQALIVTVCLQKRTREVEGGQRPVALPEYTALAPGGLDAALICHVAGEMHLLCTIQKESTI